MTTSLLPSAERSDTLDAERAAEFPLGAAVDPDALEAYDNAALLHRLRREEPVTWVPRYGAWLVTSKELVDEVHMSPERFVVHALDNPNRLVLGDMMLTVDGDEHRRHRAPFAQPFKASVVRARYEDIVAEHLDRLISGFETDGSVELAARFANPFAVGVAGDVLGLSFDQLEAVHDIYTAFAEGMVNAGDPEARASAEAARAQLGRLLTGGIDRLRAAPDESTLSSVIHAGPAALRTDEELLANLRVTLFGSIETVESMILNTVWALLRTPAELELVLADPALWPDAVQEGLRFLPPVGYSDRWAVHDTTLGGAEIRRGEYLLPVFHSANRDPAVFADPDRFDVRRPNGRANYSFSKGVHMCLGVNLARLQGAAALRTLFERLPSLRLDPDHPTEPVGFGFRRPPHLHLRWD